MKKRHIRASEIKNDRPIDQLFTEAVGTYLESGGEGYEVRTVVARKVQIPKGFEATPEGLAIMGRDFGAVRHRLETGAPIMVLERSDGSLWAYDDAHAIALCHQRAPLAMVRVVIIGYDPSPITVA